MLWSVGRDPKSTTALGTRSRESPERSSVLDRHDCANRVSISTDIGRNRELIDEGETGFIADGAISRLLDETLEKAWAEREKWQDMGQLAGQHIRQRYPQDPIREFADRIKSIVPKSVPQ